MKKTVAISQSNYIPWKGYFDLIHDVDVFMFYDDVQFTVRDWRNRNIIKTAQKPMWLSIPVGADRNRLICEVGLTDSSWQAEHWKTIMHCYAKAPFFAEYEEFFHWLYLKKSWNSLSELNQFLITTISRKWLGIATEFEHSSRFPSAAKKQERILELVKAVGGEIYISGPSAKSYIDPERFEAEGIELRWKDYSGYPEYPQLYPPFDHAVSIIDLLFNTGVQAPYYIWGWRNAALVPDSAVAQA
jgi:hypothetical protein